MLTTIGMTIGVGTVLMMVAIGRGAQKSITSQVRAAGMNVILVNAGDFKAEQMFTSIGEAEDPPPPGVTLPPNPILDTQNGPDTQHGRGSAKTLSLSDAANIQKMDGIQAVSGGIRDNVRAEGGGNLWLTQLKGEQAALPTIRRSWVFFHGRFFSAREEANHDKVAVIGSVASGHLFGTKNPVGETVAFKGQTFKIIGEISSGSWMVPAVAGDGQFDAIYLPVTTAQDLLAKPYLDTITVSTVSTGDVTRLIDAITAGLRDWHHLNSHTPADFTVVSQANTALTKGGLRTDFSRNMKSNTDSLDNMTLAELSKTLDRASRTMTFLLGSIAAVSLVVGGIGIMNIMLLSVVERTREIGIRRAVGAQSGEVMEQFLLEAVILSVGGGLLGILLGIAGSIAIGELVKWATELSWVAIAVSFTISAGIGILFGYYPAREAARVTPMTALRYE
jgi:putative ABC transport system permease protein